MTFRNSAVQAAAAALVLLSLTGCRLNHASTRVASLGDSLTAGWRYPAANHGVSGNTTAKMLARFDREIPGHGYRAVVILGGTNDVLLGIEPALTVRNLERMAARTVQEKAEPILCEIPPIFHSFIPLDKKDYRPAVLDLNRRIAALAEDHHYRLVDYYTPLAGHPNYSIDGVHMSRKGYLTMEAALIRQLRPY